MKTNADMVKALKGFFETHITSLNGIMEKLPETLRGDLQKLKDTLNEQLSKLPAIDPAPAAQDAAWALNSFADAVARMQEYASGLMNKLHSMTQDLSDRATALNGFEQRVQSKDLLTKDEVKTLVETAKADATQALLPQIVALRKSQVELAGLPMPADAVLAADDFQAQFDTAKTHLTQLGEKGFKLGGKGDKLVKDSAWLGTQEFAGRMDVYADILGTPAAGGDKKVEPLLGGGAGGDAKKVNVPRAGFA